MNFQSLGPLGQMFRDRIWPPRAGYQGCFLEKNMNSHFGEGAEDRGVANIQGQRFTEAPLPAHPLSSLSLSKMVYLNWSHRAQAPPKTLNCTKIGGFLKHRQVTDLDVTDLAFPGPSFRSARQVLCGDASCLFLDHFLSI